NLLKSFMLITTFPVSCISLLNKPPTFSVSCSYGTFIGFLSVFNDFWYSCINLSFFCFIWFVFWFFRSFSFLLFSVFCLYLLFCSCLVFLTCFYCLLSISFLL